jgi:hypothetical protein
MRSGILRLARLGSHGKLFDGSRRKTKIRPAHAPVQACALRLSTICFSCVLALKFATVIAAFAPW